MSVNQLFSSICMLCHCHFTSCSLLYFLLWVCGWKGYVHSPNGIFECTIMSFNWTQWWGRVQGLLWWGHSEAGVGMMGLYGLLWVQESEVSGRSRWLVLRHKKKSQKVPLMWLSACCQLCMNDNYFTHSQAHPLPQVHIYRIHQCKKH